MMSFIDDLEKRLNLVFAEDFTLNEASDEMAAPTEPLIIDMGNAAQRTITLEYSRGPYMGWKDYVAGKDYQPPMFYGSDVPMGPPDENGNPHSEKYGGVRPWSKEEIIQTVIEPGGIADKAIRQHVGGRAQGNPELVEQLKTNAAMVINYKLQKDKGIRGNKFRSFLITRMEQGLKRGLGIGYNQEHDATTGLLGYWDSLIGSAVRPIRNKQDISTIIDKLRWGGDHYSRMSANKPIGEAEGDSGVPTKFNQHRRQPILRRGYMQINAEQPGEWNEWGDYAVPLRKMGEAIEAALLSGDLDQVNAVRKQLASLHANIVSEYDKSFAPGAFADAGTGTTSFHVSGGEDGKEMERTDTADRLGQAQAKTAEQAKDVNLMKRIVTMTNAGVWTPAQEAVNAMAYLKSILSSPVNKDEFAIQKREDDGQIVYDVLSPNGSLIQSSRNSVEAQEALNQITPHSVMANDIADFSETLGMQYGKYLEPFKRALDMLSQGLKNGDNSTAQQGLNLLGGLKPQAEAEVQQERQKTSKKAKPGDLNKPPVIARKLSATEYRFLLRWYNITNYPERGTENDPEMINGEPSNWKQAGYPEFTKHKKTSIARDLGFGKQRGGQVYKSAVSKMKNVVQAAYGDMGIQLEGVSPNHTILKECIETITRELVRFFIIND